MGPKPVPFSILENSVAKRDLNSTVWSPLASFDLRNGWPTFNVYCEFASLLGSLALCGKLPCDNHAAQVEVKAALKYEGEKKTLYGGRGKALPSSAWRWAGSTFGHTLALHFGLNCAARRKISGFSGTHGSSPGHGFIFCVLMRSVTYTWFIAFFQFDPTRRPGQRCGMVQRQQAGSLVSFSASFRFLYPCLFVWAAVFFLRFSALFFGFDFGPPILGIIFAPIFGGCYQIFFVEKGIDGLWKREQKLYPKLGSIQPKKFDPKAWNKPMQTSKTQR